MFKDIVSDFKEFRIWLLNWLFYRRYAIKMSFAIRLADMKQKAFNKQFHVMLMELASGDKLVSVNRDEINKMKRKKWLPKNTNMLSLRDLIFYSTPLSRNNKSTPADRRKAKEKYLKYAKKYMSRSQT
ncbi:MAG: hypothetical protein LBN74_02360 [Prevotella sp.]|jgi:hypothetical protein|nr:hypothetical protein [Prevotella sp.]